MGVSAASAGSLSGLSWVVLVVVTALPCPWPGWEAPALLCGLVWAAAQVCWGWGGLGGDWVVALSVGTIGCCWVGAELGCDWCVTVFGGVAAQACWGWGRLGGPTVAALPVGSWVGFSLGCWVGAALVCGCSLAVLGLGAAQACWGCGGLGGVVTALGGFPSLASVCSLGGTVPGSK